MNLVAFLAALLTTSSLALAQDFDPNTEPVETGLCGAIVRANQEDGYNWFYATDVIRCLTSVPFNGAVAARFVKYYNQTLQFQSTSAYIRNPPAGYQRPAYDVFSELEQIQDKIQNDYYRNQYAFEADIQKVSLAMHDSHASLYAGILSRFSFASPYEIVSVSNGREPPKIYRKGEFMVKVHRIHKLTSTSLDDDNSNQLFMHAIEKINGISAVDYLEQFAAEQSFGMLEADADWNQLMVSPAQYILGTANPFSGGATFYPDEYLEIKYEDSDDVEYWDWLGYYNSPGYTGPLETGGDFYDFFVLGLPPANFDDQYINYTNIHPEDVKFVDDACPNSTSWAHVSAAYPSATFTKQDCLGIDSAGYITSYLLDDIKTGVISIPSFDEFGPQFATFSRAVVDFRGNASGNAEHIIIDLQQNTGGQVSLAFDTFRNLFPGFPISQLSAGSRTRSHPLANDLGSTLTARFQGPRPSEDDYSSYTDLVASEWVVTDRLNVQTGRNFSSWQEYYGPRFDNDDGFSLVQQYNLSSQVFDSYALGIEFPGCFFTDTGCGNSPWTGDQVILLTDGVCASACALFVELVTENIPGVHTVVVGGRPRDGPMQLVSGSRGAHAYSGYELDGDVVRAQFVDPSTASQYTYDTGIIDISHMGYNLRDQMRRNSSVPTQFLYIPADCRLYWTFDNWNNYTQLWHDAYEAIFQDSSLCVPGSVNATAPKFDQGRRSGKRAATEQVSTLSEYIGKGIDLESSSAATTDGHFLGYLDGGPEPKPITFCDTGAGTKPVQCRTGGCHQIELPCTKDGCRGRECSSSIVRHVCMDDCRTISTTDTLGGCPTLSYCQTLAALNTKTNNKIATIPGAAQPRKDAKNNGGSAFNIRSGYCAPIKPSLPLDSCSASDSDIQAYVESSY